MLHALRRPSKIGSPPGTVVPIGKQKVVKATLAVLDYERCHSSLRQVLPLAEACPRRSGLTWWVMVCGLQDYELLGQLGRQGGIHPLVLEAMANTSQRPKVNLFGQDAFVVMQLVNHPGATARPASK
ncbi:MAG: hypothetical protein ACUVTG_12695 [Candidatus Oleimicrobiaceae bacterium]